MADDRHPGTGDPTRLLVAIPILALGEAAFAQACRSQKAFSVILVAVDDFINIQRTYGIALADFVLKRLAQTIQSSTRGQDQSGRYRDEKILILLPHSCTAEARIVAHRLSKRLRTLRFKHRGESFSVSASMGISSRAERRQELFLSMVERAGQALAVAKQNGRGLVAVREATPELTPQT